MLALSHCDNRQQTKQTEEDIARKKESERVSTVVKTKSLRNAIESKYRLTTEEIIANELKAVMDEYERVLDEPIPNCEQCSDLELLLILERVLKVGYSTRGNAANQIFTITMPSKNIKSISYVEKYKTAEIKFKLQEIEAKYEGKFNVPVPWWWMCSVEERIRRLEEAIMMGNKYEYYPGASGYTRHYKFAKAISAYELQFNKSFTRCGDISHDYHHLENAMEMGLPFLSYEEDTKLKTKLKTGYQKKFGKPIPDTVLSMARVYVDNSVFKFSVTRTVTGSAIAKNITYGLSAPFELELSIEEWLDFTNDLYKLILERQERMSKATGRRGIATIDHFFRRLYIDLLNSNRQCFGDITDVWVDLDGNDFNELINNMAERIKKDGKTSHD